MKIAVSGAIGSGKTTVCEILQELGAHVVFADAITHQLLSQTSPLYEKIISLLGQEIVENNEIDRTKVANLVFSNPAVLHQLEQLLHPEIIKEIQRHYGLLENNNKLFVVEFPLLFEIGFDQWFDKTIAIVADENIREKRFMEKGFSSSQFFKRSKRLLPQDEVAKRADFIVDNNTNFQDLYTQINKLLTKLKEETKQ